MFNIRGFFKKKSRSYPYRYNNWEDYASYSGKSVPGKRKKRIFSNKFFLIILVLVVVLTIREIELPGGEKARESMRYLLTAEWDFRPLWEDAVKAANQMANRENPVLHQWPGNGPATPVAGESLTGGSTGLPVSGKVVREFGWSVDPLDGMSRFHGGIDIQAVPGSEVQAVMNGKVIHVGQDGRIGKYVLIDHGKDMYSLYAGLENIKVQKGNQVQEGEKIAETGSEGDVPGGGLHFELREDGTLVDPLEHLGPGK